MNIRWLVTPYFFDEFDPALKNAVPPGVPFRENRPGDPGGRLATQLARTHLPIAGFVQRACLRGDLPVSIAGDCGASLPVMAGLQRAGVGPVLVWLDAHGDFNTPRTSPSGFIGGMPLAMMVGRGDMSIPQISGLAPVPEETTWLIGARDLDPLEERALAASRVNRGGIDALGDLEFARPVHLHIDNDVIDAGEVPANNYPVGGGPSLGDVIEGSAAFAARNRLCAVSFSGWNGGLDRDGATARACARLLKAVLDAQVRRERKRGKARGPSP